MDLVPRCLLRCDEFGYWRLTGVPIVNPLSIGLVWLGKYDVSIGKDCCWIRWLREGLVLRVSLFITCYNDTLFPETGKAVVRVLERLGHTVEFPAGQTCCGQMHWNTGYQAEAMPLLPRFVEQFREAEAVVALRPAAWR